MQIIYFLSGVFLISKTGDIAGCKEFEMSTVTVLEFGHFGKFKMNGFSLSDALGYHSF